MIHLTGTARRADVELVLQAGRLCAPAAIVRRDMCEMVVLGIILP